MTRHLAQPSISQGLCYGLAPRGEVVWNRDQCRGMNPSDHGMPCDSVDLSHRLLINEETSLYI